jgi:hypothetical protein
MKAVQYFSNEYLERCRGMKTEDILRFLDDFRRLHGSSPVKSKLISIKVPEDLLNAFRASSIRDIDRLGGKVKDF